MAVHAATATLPVHNIAVALLMIAAVTFGYLLWCWASPFTRCGRCDANGKIRTRTGRAWRPCPRCHGDAYRLRLGRHLVNYLRQARRDVPLKHRTRNR